MWTEIIFSRDDILHLLEQALPLTIHLGDDGAEHSLTLSELGDVSLVADVGLRMVCKARVHWPVLGIDVPVALNSLTAVLMPTIGQSGEGDSLVFRLSIEHADFAGLPEMVDDRITVAINAKLAEKESELSWDFTKALTCVAPLPALLEPLQSLAIKPAWGKIRITGEAIVYAASFHSALVRRGAGAIEDRAAPPAETTRATTRRPNASELATKRAVNAGLYGIAAVAAYVLLRSALRWRA